MNNETLRFNLNCPRLSKDCRRCYALNDNGTINRAAHMEPTCESCHIPSVVNVTLVRVDSFSRPIYRTANGIPLVDVNCGQGEPKLCTMTEQGEPDSPVRFKCAIVERRAEIIHQPKATPDYPYNVHIITNGAYCGFGRFCRTEEEAKQWIRDNYGDIATTIENHD